MRSRAWDQFADFLDTAVSIALGTLTFFYLVLGDRLELAERIVASAAPFSFAAFVYSLKLRQNRRRIRKFKREPGQDSVLAYVTARQIRRDLALTAMIPFLMFLLTLIDRYIDSEDMLQITLVFLLALAWHRYFWRDKRGEGADAAITVNDRLKDELAVYSLPVLTAGISLLFLGFDLVDALQALAAFFPLWFSRYLIYKGI